MELKFKICDIRFIGSNSLSMVLKELCTLSQCSFRSGVFLLAKKPDTTLIARGKVFLSIVLQEVSLDKRVPVD